MSEQDTAHRALLLNRLLAMVTRLFRQSGHVHIRTREIQTLRELIDLIDRFVDDEVAYPLEWDDFISWRNSNPNIEEIRNRIGAFEPLLFSGSKQDRVEYMLRIVEERNIAAALVGLPARNANLRLGGER
jgi:hypothetical protein